MGSRRRSVLVGSERTHHDAWLLRSVLRLPSLWALAVSVALLVLFPFAATALIPVGTFETLDNASDVEVVGGLAYVAASSAHDAERMRRPAQYFKLEKFHRISAGLTAISAR